MNKNSNAKFNFLVNEVINYLFEEEKNHYGEFEKPPRNHIYLQLKKLKKLNDKMLK
jgi:hypothetical protein